MFGQIFNMGGSSSGSNGDDSTLTVAEVVVSVGQQVSEGDPLYLLEEDSVSDLEEELQSNVEKAKADLEAVEADQTLSRQQAKYTYDSSTAYGSYIDTEYSTTLQELQNAVDSAASALEQAQSGRLSGTAGGSNNCLRRRGTGIIQLPIQSEQYGSGR